MKTKEKILQTSIELFNKSGVVAVTTNHIAKELKISPGNLYFHFKNKEEIIRQLFTNMAKEINAIWKPHPKKAIDSPLTMTNKTFDVYWKYRFLHRELYHLKRKDLLLQKLWRGHLDKSIKMLIIAYRKWAKDGMMKPIDDLEEMEFITDVLLATATTFMQSFESRDKEPAKQALLKGQKYIIRILKPYALNETEKDFLAFLKS